MVDTAPETEAARDDDEVITPDFVRAIEDAIEAKDAAALRRLTEDLHEADLADLIQLLRPEERAGLIEALGADFKAAALPELDESVRDQVLEDMRPEQVAEALQQLDSDEAVYLLEDLDEGEQKDILAKLPYFERIALQRSLEYPEDSAGRIMQTDLIAVPPFWSVGQTIDYMRVAEDLPDRFYEIFVVDPAYHLIGSVALNRLLRSRRPTTSGPRAVRGSCSPASPRSGASTESARSSSASVPARMVASGLWISCITPAASWPTAASLSVCDSCCCAWRHSVTSSPIVITCVMSPSSRRMGILVMR